MKNMYNIFLLLFLAAGLVMIGCAAPTGKIDASDGDASTAGTVDISWINCDDGPWDVYRSSTTPFGTFTNIGAAASASFTDTDASGQIYFYKVAIPAAATIAA